MDGLEDWRLKIFEALGFYISIGGKTNIISLHHIPTMKTLYFIHDSPSQTNKSTLTVYF